MTDIHSPILALDVDGVIIDGFPKRSWDETMEADLGIARAALTEAFFAPHWRGIMLGREPMMPLLAEALSKMGSAVTAQAFVEYWHGNDANVRHAVIDAAIAWQARAGGSQKARLVLATNQEPVRAKYLWETLGLRDHFDFMIVSCRIGAAKPEPDYFQKADEALGRTPGQPVIFLDDLAGNVENARAHGWQALHVESCDHAVEILNGL